MAAATQSQSPPRPASPSPSRPNVVVQKSTHALQISPNLEALLQHDELTRRNSGSSPTSGPVGPTTTPSEFPISLPPPPPRKVQGLRKASQREQEVFHTARIKEEKRKWTAIAGWPNALPTALPPDDGQSTTVACSNSSRPATPNPYINPTPVLTKTDDDDGMARFHSTCLLTCTYAPSAPAPFFSQTTLPCQDMPSLASTLPDQ